MRGLIVALPLSFALWIGLIAIGIAAAHLPDMPSSRELGTIIGAITMLGVLGTWLALRHQPAEDE